MPAWTPRTPTACFLATLTAWCERHCIPYSAIPVGTIKKHATGKGNADKAAMVAAVRALGYEPEDDNEADAIALLDFVIETEVPDLPPGAHASGRRSPVGHLKT